MHTLMVIVKDMTAVAKVTTSTVLGLVDSPANRVRAKHLAKTLMQRLS